jgi:hypothetical protein
MRRRDLLIAFLIVLVFALTAALCGAVGLASTGASRPERYSSSRFGFSLPVPDGWHRSRTRLVALLDPREIVSLGNFAMRVGGGGDCGREPSAAIDAMRPGDALLTIQEVAVSAGLRPHLRHNFPPRPRRFDGELEPRAYLGSRRTAGSMRYEKLAFSAHGRAFEALVYVEGPPTPALRADLAEILDGLRLGPSPRTRPEPAPR